MPLPCGYPEGRGPSLIGPRRELRLLPFDDGAEVGHDSKNAVRRVVDVGHFSNSPGRLGRRNTGISCRDEAQNGLRACLAFLCGGGI